MGGGHHITRADYDVELLINIIKRFREKYGVEVYLCLLYTSHCDSYANRAYYVARKMRDVKVSYLF